VWSGRKHHRRANDGQASLSEAIASAVGSRTQHMPRGRDTQRNSLVPLGAGESPRSALSPAVSVPRITPPTTERGKRDLRHRKWSQATSNDRLGFLAVPRLWGLPDSPQAQAVGFPTHTHRYSESPYGSSPLGSLLRSVRPPGTDSKRNVEPSNGSNPLDQHICPLTCASVATERVTRQTARASVSGRSRDRSQPSARRASARCAAAPRATS
jgi:hypothetical protein